MTEIVPPRPPRPDASQIETWIRQAREGSDSVLGELFDVCQKYLLLVANRAIDSDLRPKGGASDVVQDTFVEAKRGFADFRGESEGELFAWLKRILSHQISRHARTYRTAQKRDVNRENPLDGDQREWLPDDGDNTPSALIVAQEERERVQAALGRLPDDQQQVLVLRTWQQLPFEEIGRNMNRSTDAARKLWARAVERLGRELNETP